MPSDLGPWDPMTPDEVEKLLGSAPCMWWIAGGWAIDLHIGRQTRDHDDIDVLILRDDQLLVQEALNGWELHAADPPGTLRAAGKRERSYPRRCTTSGVDARPRRPGRSNS